MPLSPIFWFTILTGIVPLVEGHGCITKIVGPNGVTACAGTAPDPSGCTGTMKLRKLIARSGNTGECANPPGCEASFNCDWCGLEKVRTFNSLISSKWWTGMPAAHWDNPLVAPKFPCMTKDAFGARGKMTVNPGDSLKINIFINADHSGLYQYQLACGIVDDNSKFAAITPWKALHKDKEGFTLGNDRVVGSTRQETDAYYAKTTCTGAACPYRMNRGNAGPGNCANGALGADDCVIVDTITIPSNTVCRGDTILRWLWNSAEGPETYANCLDLNVQGSTVPATSNPTSAPTKSPTQPPPTQSGYVPPVTSSPTAYVPPDNTDWGCTKRWAVGGEQCDSNPLCCPGGTSCYEKDENWSDCRNTCVKGVHADDPVKYQTEWTCALLGVGYPKADGHGTGLAGAPPSIYQPSKAIHGTFSLVIIWICCIVCIVSYSA